MRTIRLSSVEVGVTTLGPSPAIGIWVQGCGIGCHGCMSPHTHAPDGGVVALVDDVADWASSTDHSNLVISGGEPTDQAPALTALIDRLRAERDWTVTCYTGRLREDLERDVPAGSTALLERLDLLIDGPYRADLHAPLRWRGSSNQRVHELSGRVEMLDDEPAGLQVVSRDDGAFELVGVPSEPGLVRALRAQLAAAGFQPSRGAQPQFPFPTTEDH